MIDILYTNIIDFLMAFPIIMPIVIYITPIIIAIRLSEKLCYIIASILATLVALIILFVEHWTIGFAGLTWYISLHWIVILCVCTIIKSVYNKNLRNRNIKISELEKRINDLESK